MELGKGAIMPLDFGIITVTAHFEVVDISNFNATGK